MIAFSIATTWLILTAAGFAGLSALGRAEAHKDVEADRTALKSWPAGDRSGSDQSLVLADARSLIARALLG